MALENIMNVESSTFIAGVPKITLRLAKAGRFGIEIAFLPVAGFTVSKSGKNKIADGLIERAYAARFKHGI